MPGYLQRTIAGFGILDKAGNIVSHITHDCAGEGDHTDQHGDQTDDDQRHAGLPDIGDHVGNTSRVQDHTDRIKH